MLSTRALKIFKASESDQTIMGFSKIKPPNYPLKPIGASYLPVKLEIGDYKYAKFTRGISGLVHW